MSVAAGLLVLQLTHLAAAAGALALAVWLLARRARRGPAAVPMAAALLLSGCWSIAQFGQPAGAVGEVLLAVSYLGWLWVLHRLFARDRRDRTVAPVRPVVLALAAVELLQIGLMAVPAFEAGSASAEGMTAQIAVTMRLLFCVGALVLVHNLYVGAAPEAREPLRLPAAALGTMWLYDLNLSTVAYLAGEAPELLVALRGVAVLAMVALLAAGSLRHGATARFRPSRSFAFQSFALLAIGGYLVAMVVVAQALSYAGGDWPRAAQAAFVLVAGLAALMLLPSRKLRGWLRVTLAKHLFQHRYDYRSEWLRFTGTIGRAGPNAPPLSERIIQAVADITDSPSGLLLTPAEGGGLTLEVRWQWPEIAVPGEALSQQAVRFFETRHFILDLDDVRSGKAGEVPEAACPQWLVADHSAWALIPLLHYDRLVGAVVVARPPVARRLDWEDFDLLRVVGRQLASYLTEQASQNALGEAQRFDEFNRRMAFVMHDIKNLTSQLALLARNAERHSDKPEFRADMLVTLRSSADKLQGLLQRLGRYGTHGAEAREVVSVPRILERVAGRHRGQHAVEVTIGRACKVVADAEGLEQALVHLVQNAIDASHAGAPILLEGREAEGRAIIVVADMGTGMSAEFIRTSLFRPFHSSKSGGFGIGAYEARELVRAMGGTLQVESREGQGTRFVLSLPLAEEEQIYRPIDNGKAMVA